MTTIRCDIVSAEANIFHGEAVLVIASGEAGELGIAPRHEPLLTRLKPGQVEVIGEDGKRQSYYVSGGILEVQPNVVTVLADTALRAKDLEESAALAAKQRAEEALSKATDKIEQAEAMKEIVRMAEQVKMIQRLRKGK